jgi:hypothetical protein
MSLAAELLGACFIGLVAAICMTIFELPFRKKWGIEGVTEWQVNAVIVSVLIRKFTRKRVNSSMTVAMHLFHGAALGIVFRVLLGLLGAPILSSSVLIFAIAYSNVLWIISPLLTRRFFELAGSFRITKKGLAVSLLAHNVYGVFLGLLMPVFV